MTFVEAQHPRHPRGDVQGGEFAPKPLTGAQAASYLKNLHAGALGVLDERQENALDRYVGQATYGTINKALRTDGEYGALTAKRIGLIDESFASVTATDQPVRVYRGIRDWQRTLGPDPQVGMVVADRGYPSTSTSRATAEGFVTGKRAALVEITVPAGTKALYVPALYRKWIPASSKPKPEGVHSFWGSKENELILPRDRRFRVTRVTIPTDGPARIQMEMVP